LKDRLGIDKIDRIPLAGAFGSHVDPKYAMLLGMIPDCPLDKVSAAGNAAGTGSSQRFSNILLKPLPFRTEQTLSLT
jgi:uncharacterized 2Fe-2S/4Fe-4S cluster protein (DUF4445 family)